MRAIAIVSLVAIAACVPLYPKVRQQRRGTVIDDQSGAPVPNALVRVESYRIPTPPGFGRGTLLHRLETRTRPDGSWTVPSERDWTIGILVADGLPLYLDVYSVSADGYETAVLNPWPAWIDGPKHGSAPKRSGREMPAELRLHRDPQSSP